MKRGVVMKQDILSIVAAIALFLMLFWIYMTPFRNAAEADSQIRGGRSEPFDNANDYKRALESDFHTLFNVLFDH
jgi:hypothetical protein